MIGVALLQSFPTFIHVGGLTVVVRIVSTYCMHDEDDIASPSQHLYQNPHQVLFTGIYMQLGNHRSILLQFGQ